MKPLRTCLSVLALALAVGSAWAGDLQPVDAEPRPEFRGGYEVVGRFGKPPADAGTVSPQAVVAGNGKLKVAVDSKTVDGPPNVLRLDFSGKGLFADAPTIDIKVNTQGQNSSARFGSTVVKPTIRGKTVPVRVSGIYRKQGTNRSLYLQVVSAATGDVAFGDATHAVRVYYHGLDVPGRPSGLLIDTDGKDFGDDAIVALPGQPVRIGETFYRLAVDGWKASAEPMKIGTATVKVPQGNWTIRGVWDRRSPVMYAGEADGAVIPAGKYKIEYYRVEGPGRSYMEHHGRTGPELKAPAGEATEWKLGEGLTAKVTTRVSSGQVTFSFAMQDAEGLKVLGVADKDSRRVPAPGVEVRDASGKVVHTGKMRYG